MYEMLQRGITTIFLLAMAGLCGWWVQELLQDARELERSSSSLEKPEIRLVQNPKDSVEALHHLHQRNASTNHMGLEATMLKGDRGNWSRHAANIAAQRGWYAHQVVSNPTLIIVPERDRELLEGIPADPYGWLQKMQTDGPAAPPDLGEDPIHVGIWTVSEDTGAGRKQALAVLPLVLGIILFASGLSAPFIMDPNGTALRNKG